MKRQATIRSGLKRSIGGIANRALTLRPPTASPLAIFGNGRSGTSWIGKTLGMAQQAIYYREPCNPQTVGVDDDTVWSRYIRPGGTDAFFEHSLEQAFVGLFAPGSNWGLDRLPLRMSGTCRVVVKEVATYLSIEWLCQRWNPEVLIVVRHPCASGLSVLNLDLAAAEASRLDAMLNDAALLEDHLAPFRLHLKSLVTPTEIAAAIWAIKNYVAMRARVRHPDWKLVRYEDVCLNPVEEFSKLYSEFNLHWSPDIAASIEAETGCEGAGPHSTSRISRHRVDAWKQSMSRKAIEQVRAAIEPFEIPYYETSRDW